MSEGSGLSGSQIYPDSTRPSGFVLKFGRTIDQATWRHDVVRIGQIRRPEAEFSLREQYARGHLANGEARHSVTLQAALPLALQRFLRNFSVHRRKCRNVLLRFGIQGKRDSDTGLQALVINERYCWSGPGSYHPTPGRSWADGDQASAWLDHFCPDFGTRPSRIWTSIWPDWIRHRPFWVANFVRIRHHSFGRIIGGPKLPRHADGGRISEAGWTRHPLREARLGTLASTWAPICFAKTLNFRVHRVLAAHAVCVWYMGWPTVHRVRESRKNECTTRGGASRALTLETCAYIAAQHAPESYVLNETISNPSKIVTPGFAGVEG
ncbi:hypothetical protein BD310DRAFT_1004820 [Dichomitus squalens]|uniref:Uncharacterized protein n=1 Tax=Dichomitus squalens TaxID=114155 RepID=A0A4V2K8L4_9APHY|nr:hypothetical protein BD310DRAFT_1004820 [Dichomitus squalens]